MNILIIESTVIQYRLEQLVLLEVTLWRNQYLMLMERITYFPGMAYSDGQRVSTWLKEDLNRIDPSHLIPILFSLQKKEVHIK